MQMWTDFVIPVRRDLAGEVILQDWYGVHVRVGRTIGARTVSDIPRYTYSDDPTSPDFGQGIRIRSADPDVCTAMREIGIPVVSRGRIDDIRDGLVMDLCMMVSARRDRHASRILSRDGILALLVRNGFLPRNPAALLPDPGNYVIRKGSRQAFVRTGLKLRAQVSVVDADAARRAILEGVGRDRGLGFGMVVPQEMGASG